MTKLVGILNTTPDSFSDGGHFLDASAAVDHARQLVNEGAAIIDIGGESTRPGATRVTPEEEQRRILEIVRRVKDLGVTVSVDTVNASTAAAALAAGADIINDVSGRLHDPQMLKTVAKHNAGFIAGHWRGFPKPDNSRSDYVDVVAEVIEQLQQRAAAARQAGIAASKIVRVFNLNHRECAAAQLSIKLVDQSEQLGKTQRRFGAVELGVGGAQLRDPLPAAQCLNLVPVKVLTKPSGHPLPVNDFARVARRKIGSVGDVGCAAELVFVADQQNPVSGQHNVRFNGVSPDTHSQPIRCCGVLRQIPARTAVSDHERVSGS